MLGTTRIVLFDTTIKRCSPAEIQMILGHEMAHYVLNHVWKGIGFLSLLIVLGFLLVRWAYARAMRRWPAMGVQGIADIAGLPLMALLLSVFLFVLAPVLNTWSRVFELDADNFGLMASREPDAAATTFLKLGEYRDLEPHPLVERLLYDHPSGRTRILNAMEWKRAQKR
jgi:STE24 endopeptidase